MREKEVHGLHVYNDPLLIQHHGGYVRYNFSVHERLRDHCMVEVRLGERQHNDARHYVALKTDDEKYSDKDE